MGYLLAIFLPPIAILLCGKPIQTLVNLVIIAAGFFVFPPLLLIAPIHGVLVVSSHHADKRTTRIVKSINKKPQQ